MGNSVSSRRQQDQENELGQSIIYHNLPEIIDKYERQKQMHRHNSTQSAQLQLKNQKSSSSSSNPENSMPTTSRYSENSSKFKNQNVSSSTFSAGGKRSRLLFLQRATSNYLKSTKNQQKQDIPMDDISCDNINTHGQKQSPANSKGLNLNHFESTKEKQRDRAFSDDFFCCQGNCCAGITMRDSPKASDKNVKNNDNEKNLSNQIDLQPQNQVDEQSATPMTPPEVKADKSQRLQTPQSMHQLSFHGVLSRRGHRSNSIDTDEFHSAEQEFETSCSASKNTQDRLTQQIQDMAPEDSEYSRSAQEAPILLHYQTNGCVGDQCQPIIQQDYISYQDNDSVSQNSLKNSSHHLASEPSLRSPISCCSPGDLKCKLCIEGMDKVKDKNAVFMVDSNIMNDYPDFCVHCPSCIQIMTDRLRQAAVEQFGSLLDESLVAKCLRQLIQIYEEREANNYNHKHHDDVDHRQVEIQVKRRNVLRKEQKKRIKYTFAQPQYQVTRTQMIRKVSTYLADTIAIFMDRIQSTQNRANVEFEDVRECSLLFKEHNFGKRKWQVEIPSTGVACILPHFTFNAQITEQSMQEELENLPSVDDISRFIYRIMHSVQLSNEVCLMSFIFIEKLLKVGKVQLLTINWRPIIYAAILLAAKFMEDIYFWNEDFVLMIRLYDLKATNQLENTFLALCRYELFVPESLYDKYYRIIVGKQPEDKHPRHNNQSSHDITKSLS